MAIRLWLALGAANPHFLPLPRRNRSMSDTARFHPAVGQWFNRHFTAPTAPQARAWPLIRRGQNVLVAAPTGSGKTLAAFLSAIDNLVTQGVKAPLPDETIVVYVSPLKALSNDIQRNLAVPLAGIRRELEAMGLPDVEIRTLVRTGDTPQAERAGMRKRPPHIVVTTPSRSTCCWAPSRAAGCCRRRAR